MVAGHPLARLPMPENHSLLLDKKFVLKSPPPWKLKGEGILLIYKFKKEWVESQGNLPKHLLGKFKGGLGFVMLVNYEDTPVGPYHEVLFIPGKFRKTKKQAITKIYVDSEVSTQNGRINWGIPKETLPIEWEKEKNWDKVRVVKNGAPIFSAEFETGGIPFPVSTAFLPIRLCQTWNKLKFFTRLTATGVGKLTKLKNLDLNPEFFPDIRGFSPLFAVKVNPIYVRFPKPTFRNEFF